MKIEVYTDGSATTKDKPGGYGWVIIIDGQFHSEGSGSIPNATNNDAELEAAIIGLGNAYKVAPKGGPVELVSDSEIILKWVNGTNRFKQASKMHKYEALKRLHKMMCIHTRWVQGHSGDQWNERCDKLAGAARDLAMGVVRKPRKNKVKPLKEACEKMANLLDSIEREFYNCGGDFGGMPSLGLIKEVLDFYKEKLNG